MYVSNLFCDTFLDHLRRPHGRTASKSVWTSASLAAAPAEAPAAVPPHILGAEPPLAEGERWILTILNVSLN